MRTTTHPSSGVLATGCGLLFIILAPHSSCGTTQANAGVRAVYDPQTGALQQLVYDANRNGRPDAWSYMDGTRVVRIELDRNEDSVVDRWEYYDANRNLLKVGIASGGDGLVDMWAFPAPDGGPRQIERSTRRDGTIDRTEFYEKGILVRAEQDVDHDGMTDKWETYEDGSLASAAFDTTHQGVPDKRFVYRPDGSPPTNRTRRSQGAFPITAITLD